LQTSGYAGGNGLVITNTGILAKKGGANTFAIGSDGTATFGGDISTNGYIVANGSSSGTVNSAVVTISIIGNAGKTSKYGLVGYGGTGGCAVLGESTNGITGVSGTTTLGGTGVNGQSVTGNGVAGNSQTGSGVSGAASSIGYGVYGQAGSPGYGVWATNAGTGEALHVTGKMTINNSTQVDKLNAEYVGGYRANLGSSSAWWGRIPVVEGGAGVMEVGRYIDFHSTNADTADNTYRLDNNAPNNLWFSGTSSSGSDRRIKKNILPLENSLAKIRQLTGVYFEYIAGGSSLGFIAQEVEPLFPDLISEGSNGYLGVNYGGMVAPIVEALKTLADKLEDLQTQINALKN
jgi:hypothetical protein